MKHLKMTLLGAVAVLAFTPVTGEAREWRMMNGYPMYYNAYSQDLTMAQWMDLRAYEAYEHREPCQNYRIPPMGFDRAGCDLIYRVAPSPQLVASSHSQTTVKRTILASYTVNFAFDSSALEEMSEETLAQIAHDIKRYNPREVTIAGHTDRAGASDYNVALSQRRADRVSQALNGRGVANRIIDEEAYGEESPAIDTNDGVALHENRRVVIEFLK